MGEDTQDMNGIGNSELFCAIHDRNGMPCLLPAIYTPDRSGELFEISCPKHKRRGSFWTYADCIKVLFEKLAELERKNAER